MRSFELVYGLKNNLGKCVVIGIGPKEKAQAEEVGFGQERCLDVSGNAYGCQPKSKRN